MALFSFSHTFSRALPFAYIAWQPQPVARPQLLFFNEVLADAIDLPWRAFTPEILAELLSGNQLPEGAKPIAQAYAGHQFGRFAPQLGDGRAVILGEITDRGGKRYDVAFKGSGPTPFSRGGDGKAAVGPMLREAIMGEALAGLGIPTSRALAVVATGEPVYRERVLPGAVLTRIAASHLRIGTFEFFAAHGSVDQLQQLVDYAITRHYPDLTEASDRYLAFLAAVADRQAALIAQWMAVGFIHGVMNTDNMAISGETIDFGPCAFLERYDPDTWFSSIDRSGRYRYQNQPLIAQWNLARLAEALLPLLGPTPPQSVEAAQAVIDSFPGRFTYFWNRQIARKLGWQMEHPDDAALIDEWCRLLAQHQVDWTLAFRSLIAAARGDRQPLLTLVAEPHATTAWLERWHHRTMAEWGDEPTGREKLADWLAAVNPLVIARNEAIERVLTAAEAGDLAPFQELITALRHPFSPSAPAHLTIPSSATFMAQFRTFCGT